MSTMEEFDFEILLKKHLKPVYNFVLHISKDAEEASDITQEIFIKVWKNLNKIDPNKNFKTWLFTIARNTTFDYLRKRKNIAFSQINPIDTDETYQDFSDTLTDPEPLPDEIFNKKELAKELNEALTKIRPDFREIIFLHYKENLKLEEISEITNKPLNTIKSRHKRALETLRKLLKN